MRIRFVIIAATLVISAFAVSSRQMAYGQITSPGTNTFVLAGANQRISWNVGRDSKSIVLLQYSTDAGSTWNHIAATGIAAGSYNWVIPVTVNSFLCKVRMVKYTRREFTRVAETGNFSIARMFSYSTINEVFSHRVIALTDTSKHHYNRIQFFH